VEVALVLLEDVTLPPVALVVPEDVAPPPVPDDDLPFDEQTATSPTSTGR
jgi:hypothetical protein